MVPQKDRQRSTMDVLTTLITAGADLNMMSGKKFWFKVHSSQLSLVKGKASIRLINPVGIRNNTVFSFGPVEYQIW